MPAVSHGYYHLPILNRYTVDHTGCWRWLGNISRGYGRCKGDPESPQKTRLAHRVFYEHHVGPIPEGLELDHLCRNRWCVNPEHLEPVTRAVNVRRGAHTKLTQEQADEIRVTMDELCERYGVRPRTLAAIAERQIWKPGTEYGASV